MSYTATRADLEESANALFEVVKSGAVKIEIHQRFKLSEAADAHRALEGRQTTGSTVFGSFLHSAALIPALPSQGRSATTATHPTATDQEA